MRGIACISNPSSYLQRDQGLRLKSVCVFSLKWARMNELLGLLPYDLLPLYFTCKWVTRNISSEQKNAGNKVVGIEILAKKKSKTFVPKTF